MKKKKELKKCPGCGRVLIPDKTALNWNTGKWDGHTFLCECMPEGSRICVG